MTKNMEMFYLGYKPLPITLIPSSSKFAFFHPSQIPVKINTGKMKIQDFKENL